MVRDAVRQFIDKEIRPHVDELEHGDTPPYDVLRKLFATFGMDVAARDRFKKQIEFEKPVADGDRAGRDPAREARARRATAAARRSRLIPIIELCRVCPGMVTAMGVSMGLTSAAINAKGTIAQKERWVPELLTHGEDRRVGDHRARLGLGRVRLDEGRPPGATATSTCSTARRPSSPTARTPTRSCSSASSTRATRRPSARCSRSSSIGGMPGLEQSKPLRKMGMHSSPTGELFLDRRAGRPSTGSSARPRTSPAGGREGAKATFMQERSGVAAMALGIIEECLDLSRRSTPRTGCSSASPSASSS